MPHSCRNASLLKRNVRFGSSFGCILTTCSLPFLKFVCMFQSSFLFERFLQMLASKCGPFSNPVPLVVQPLHEKMSVLKSMREQLNIVVFNLDGPAARGRPV